MLPELSTGIRPRLREARPGTIVPTGGLVKTTFIIPPGLTSLPALELGFPLESTDDTRTSPVAPLQTALLVRAEQPAIAIWLPELDPLATQFVPLTVHPKDRTSTSIPLTSTIELDVSTTATLTATLAALFIWFLSHQKRATSAIPKNRTKRSMIMSAVSITVWPLSEFLVVSMFGVCLFLNYVLVYPGGICPRDAIMVVCSMSSSSCWRRSLRRY
jgi:hypothetical protein